MSIITLTVDTFLDENDGTISGSGLSLRDAIIMANNDINNDYIIKLSSGGTYTFTIGGANGGDLNIVNGANVTIRTNGTILATINANNLDRVFAVAPEGTLSLENMVITGGRASDGGGIYNEGTLNTLQTTVRNNTATSFGGGVINYGTAVIKQSTIEDNNSGSNTYGAGGIANGSWERGHSGCVLTILQSTVANNNSINGNSGGIYSFLSTLNIIQSTISGNYSKLGGGGIGNDHSTLIISQSTISGNSTNGNGGGIFNWAGGSALLVNTTITNNTADAYFATTGSGVGGGIYNEEGNVAGGPIVLRNTIVAGNFDSFNNNGPGTINPDIAGPVQGNANNLIGNLTGATGTVGTGSDIVLAAGQNAGLGPLQNNGGLTQTHALLIGSPAINAGSNVSIDRDLADIDGDGNKAESMPLDQRGTGFSRIYGSSVDIGAFELQDNNSTTPPPDPLLNTQIYRFQNRNVPGTYLFAGEQERQGIRANFPNFVEEGPAFKVSAEPSEDLITMYRFQNTAIPGTYLYAGEEERLGIIRNYPNFREEGVAFYVYESNANKGIDFFRFQNSNIPGTYLFAGQTEANSIIVNYPNFNYEGTAFEVGT